MKKRLIIPFFAIVLAIGCNSIDKNSPGDHAITERWSKHKANEWYQQHDWLVGCNYIPATAINQLEMWQAETFDQATMDKELGWAADIGFNIVRVYLHNLLWKQDSTGFKQRINQFLDICEKHQVGVMFVLFDDCWYGNPELGEQPQPVPGLHNSGWLQCPGHAQVTDTSLWPELEVFAKGVMTAYANDERVLVWDLYNEPGQNSRNLESLPLLKKAFTWAREVDPLQPITSGCWNMRDREIYNFQLENSDIITFHNYSKYENMAKDIAKYSSYGRPVICTE